MRRIVVALALACLFTGAVQATPITMHTANSPVGNQAWSGLVGLEFDVIGSNFTVHSLGVYDSGADGIVNPAAGGSAKLTTILFDSTQTPIAMVEFTSADGAGAGGYLFQSISPLVLAPGRYGIVSFGFDTANPLHNTNFGGAGPDRAPELSYVRSIWSSGTDPSTAVFSSGVTDYFDAPNMTFTIPAPGAVLLSAIGAGLVGWMRRRKAL